MTMDKQFKQRFSRIASDPDIPADNASDRLSVLFPHHQIRPHRRRLGRVRRRIDVVSRFCYLLACKLLRRDFHSLGWG